MSEHSNKRTGCQAERPANWRRVALLGAGTAGAALAAGSWALAYWSTHPPRVPLWTSPSRLGWEFEDVCFPSRDGTQLSGWFIPHPNARASLVLCHGFPMNRSEMVAWASVLWPLGVDLLLFDFRALGRSGGDLCTIGHYEVLDLLGAVDYLNRRSDTADLPIGVFGLSMGGAVAIMTAAQDERIAAVATHGAYATLDGAMARRCRMYAGPLGPALYAPTKWWGRRWFPVEPKEVSPLAAIAKISPRPVLLLHGRRDFTVSPGDSEQLYQAAGTPKMLHQMGRSWHVRIHERDRAEYNELLTGFFRTLLVEPSA